MSFLSIIFQEFIYPRLTGSLFCNSVFSVSLDASHLTQLTSGWQNDKKFPPPPQLVT